jgi:FeS assembly SUF system regulator
MIKISRLTDYAVIILAELAQTQAGPSSASAMAGRTRLPEPTVSKVMKLLAREGLITSSRGAAGGYRLSRPLAELSVADVIVAIDGPISLTTCVEGSANTCDYACRCPLRGRWDGVNLAIREALEAVSIADMLTVSVSPAIPFHAQAEESMS